MGLDLPYRRKFPLHLFMVIRSLPMCLAPLTREGVVSCWRSSFRNILSDQKYMANCLFWVALINDLLRIDLKTLKG